MSEETKAAEKDALDKAKTEKDAADAAARRGRAMQAALNAVATQRNDAMNGLMQSEANLALATEDLATANKTIEQRDARVVELEKQVADLGTAMAQIAVLKAQKTQGDGDAVVSGTSADDRGPE